MIKRQFGKFSFSRDTFLIILPMLLVIALLIWAAFSIEPAPPKSFVMTTGSETGAYHAFAKRYQEILAHYGIKIELRTSSGSVENLSRLKDPASRVQVGFVQGGIAGTKDVADLMSLGCLYYEPLWIFYRSSGSLDRIIQLKGRRLAIGPEGSGTRNLMLQILSANGMEGDEKLLPLGGSAAADALKKGDVDAVFMIAGIDAPVVKDLIHASGIGMMSLSQPIAYTKRFPFLSMVTLPRGGIDLAQNLPAQDVMMIAPTANLVARNDLHPAIVALLVKAAIEIHNGPGLFQKAREFPAALHSEIPMSSDAERYLKSGPPMLQRYLPFWIATMIDRFIVLLLPLIVLLPVIKLIPSLYAWRIRSRIFRLYGELGQLDKDIRNSYLPDMHEQYLQKLQILEDESNRKSLPLSYSHQLYMLREHINLVRNELLDKHVQREHSG